MGWLRLLLNFGITVGGLAGAALTLLYFFQEKIIYVPVLPGMPRQYPYYPDAFGLAYEDIWFEAEDGTRLNAWLIYPSHWRKETRQMRPVVVFFQENAGNMALRLHFIKSMIRVLDCNVFILSYRGYGLSHGVPSEKGLQMDAEAAMRMLNSRNDIDPNKLVIFGRSLGGAVAIYTASKFKDQIRGLIVENTFTNLEDVAGYAIPFLKPLVGSGRPCNWLLRNKWFSNQRLFELTSLPILFLSSLEDEVLPAVHMQLLYAVHGNKPWSFVPFEGARHMDCYESHAPMYWQAVAEYLDRLFSDINELNSRSHSKLT